MYISALFCSFFLLSERWIISSEGVLLLGWGGRQTKANVFAECGSVPPLACLQGGCRAGITLMWTCKIHIGYLPFPQYLFHSEGASLDSSPEGEWTVLMDNFVLIIENITPYFLDLLNPLNKQCFFQNFTQPSSFLCYLLINALHFPLDHSFLMSFREASSTVIVRFLSIFVTPVLVSLTLLSFFTKHS